VSGSRPDEDPGVYTMPADAFRIGSEPPVPVPPRPVRPPRTSASARPGRRRKGWDIALTIVLLVVLLAVAVTASVAALSLGVAAGSCGSGGRLCQDALRDLGVWMALTTPWLILVLSVFFAVILLVIRRRAFWVPLAGLLLTVVLWLLGALLVWAAI
jgi:hypothetical protein